MTGLWIDEEPGFPLLHAGDPRELVRIEMRFANETVGFSEPLPRVDANRLIEAIVRTDDQPQPGTRMVWAKLHPLVP